MKVSVPSFNYPLRLWMITGSTNSVNSVIQSLALRPSLYRRPVLYCGDTSDFHPRGPPKDDQSVLRLCTRVHHSRSVCHTRKLGSWSESVLPRGPRRLGLLLPSTIPRSIFPSTITSTADAGLKKCWISWFLLDKAIQDHLEDREYTVDVETSEEYIDSAKQALPKANHEIGRRLVLYAANPRISEFPSAQMTARHPVTHSVKLSQ